MEMVTVLGLFSHGSYNAKSDVLLRVCTNLTATLWGLVKVRHAMMLVNSKSGQWLKAKG